MAALEEPPTATPPSLPPTNRLYIPDLAGNFTYNSPAQLLHLTEIPPSEDSTQKAEPLRTKVELVFDQSPFHPQGGGQPTDIGTITSDDGSVSLEVFHVSFSFDTNVVTHHCMLMSPTPPTLNATYTLSVDAARRENLSAFHSAGHLVDSAIYRLGYSMLVPKKGYHFTDGPYVEYGNGKQIDQAERKTIVSRLNQEFETLIDQDIPTTICMMVKEDAEAELNRTANNFDFSVFRDPQVRIVGIANFKCPCGGTHVASTSDLRGFEVTGIKMKKGDLRVKYNRK